MRNKKSLFGLVILVVIAVAMVAVASYGAIPYPYTWQLTDPYNPESSCSQMFGTKYCMHCCDAYGCAPEAYCLDPSMEGTACPEF